MKKNETLGNQKASQTGDGFCQVEQLLCCPFCGSIAKFENDCWDTRGIECSNLDCPISPSISTNRKDFTNEMLIKVWNTRAT